MADDKKSFILYADLLHTVKKMPEEKAGVLFRTILEYVNDLSPSVDDLLVDLVFEPIKQQLKRDLKSYESTKEERSRNGRLGNLKRWNPELHLQVLANVLTLEEAEIIANDRKVSPPDDMVSQDIANIAVNGNVNDTVNGIDTYIKKKSGLGVDSSAKKSTTQHLKDNLENRKLEFRKTLIPFTITKNNPLGKFDGEMVKRFFDYWKEPNKSKSKMKFELEQTWDVESRLNYWENNGFDKKKNFGGQVTAVYEQPSNRIDHSNLED